MLDTSTTTYRWVEFATSPTYSMTNVRGGIFTAVRKPQPRLAVRKMITGICRPRWTTRVGHVRTSQLHSGVHSKRKSFLRSYRL